MRLSLKKWAEGDFKSDPQLNLIPSLYQKLKSEGYDFNEGSQPQKKPVELSKDPNVVSSQQEEDDIAKAIELSLKEAKPSPKTLSFNKSSTPSATSGSNSSATQSSSLYPSVSLNSGGAGTAVAAPEPRKVRALYDFEAAEDNELTFFAGEVLLVLDDSDPNWWKGQNQRGEGLFPSNFVTADLSAEPEAPFKMSLEKSSSKKVVQFSDEQSDNSFNERKEEPVQINEDTIDRLLHLLHEADPEDPSQDTDDMLRLEHQVNQMHPLIDQELERVDRKHAQLTQLSSDLAEAVGLYHQLMRDDRGYSGGYIPSMAPVSLPPHMMYQENGVGGGAMGMYNPYQMGGMQAALPSMPPGTTPFLPQQNYGPGPAFHSPIPQQMHNGHPATNGMSNYGMNPQTQPGPNEHQQNSNNFMNQPQQQQVVNPQSPPQFNPHGSPNHHQPSSMPQNQMFAPQQPQHYNMNPNQSSSPSHHHPQQFNPQQPQMLPGQTILPPPSSIMQGGGNPGMIYQHQSNPSGAMNHQNIPVYQQQR